MMPRNRLPLALVAIALVCISCAVSPEIEQRRQAIDAEIDAILAEPIDEEEYGSSQRCLLDHEFRRFRALDDRHIIFEGRRGKQWINTLRARCFDLRHGTILRVRSYSSVGRICELDTFAVDDWFNWPWYRRWPWQWASSWSTGMTCTLGEFQPVTEAQVEAIEDLLESN